MAKRDYNGMICVCAVHKFKMLDTVYNTSQQFESATVQVMGYAEYLHLLAELSEKPCRNHDLHPHSEPWLPREQACIDHITREQASACPGFICTSLFLSYCAFHFPEEMLSELKKAVRSCERLKEQV